MINFKKTSQYIKVDFEENMNFLSWAILNGGFKQGKKVYWARVENKNLPIHLDPKDVLKERMENDNFKKSVGFLTSAKLDHVTHEFEERGDLKVEILTTVGMGNALRVGDPAKNRIRVGTINILLAVNKPMSINAQLEAMNIIAEARTLAVLEENIMSKKTNLPSTGTGTDCTVVASKLKEKITEEELVYSGKHTVLAELIGKCTYSAIRSGIQKWKRDNDKNYAYCWGS